MATAPAMKDEEFGGAGQETTSRESCSKLPRALRTCLLTVAAVSAVALMFMSCESVTSQMARASEESYASD